MSLIALPFETALRATDIALALAVLIQCAEHLRGPASDRPIFAARALFALLLASGLYSSFAALGLLTTSIRLLYRYDGPYNGGADRMGLLILICLTIAHLPLPPFARELALGYLAIQLVLSYFVAGLVKIVNPDWRSGKALVQVFESTGYPASDDLRGLARMPGMLRAAAWAVMLLELAFPLALIDQRLLIAALLATGAFHLANAILFGFNRFFWTWLAAYPAILWLQERLLG